ncbi:MAG: hypothetical protein U0822_25135 [Anaerolineae bacterium]
MALDVRHLERIGQYRVIEARPARPGLFVARVQDAETGEAARLLLLLPDELEPETRALLASLAVRAPLAAAATEGEYAYLALPPSIDGTPEMLALVPGPLLPATPLLIRLRPFAAALVLVLACLVALQVVDNLAWQQSGQDTAQVPGDYWGGGSTALSVVPTLPSGLQGSTAPPTLNQEQSGGIIPMSPMGRQGGGMVPTPPEPDSIAIPPPVIAGGVPQAAAAELPATATPTATLTPAPTQTATPAPTATPTRTAVPVARQYVAPFPVTQPQYIPQQPVYRSLPQQQYVPQQYTAPQYNRVPVSGGYGPPGGYRPPSPPSRAPSSAPSWSAPVKQPSAWLR